MRKRRLIYGLGIGLLALSASLLIWLGSFNFGPLAPANPEQTILYWAVSTLVFLLTITLGFMLFRTALKLYIERQKGREGSRIKTKLVLGAFALTFLPVTFLVLWSVTVLNYNLAKWFSAPSEQVRQSFAEVLGLVERDARDLAEAQAAWLSLQPQAVAGEPLGFLCREHRIYAAVLERPDGTRAALCGASTQIPAPIRYRLAAGGAILVSPLPRPETVEHRQRIQSYVHEYDRLAFDRRSVRNFYLLKLALITLFILFFATWVALFISKQLSNPISALLEAAGEIRKGNLRHRVRVPASDELATLVRAFNEMAEALEANSLELERRRRFTEAILESIPTGVISAASDGRILRVNRALEHLLGADRVAAATRLEDLFGRDETVDLKYLMKRARRTGTASRELELSTARGTLHLAVTVAALEEKLTSAFVIVIEDTTELLRAQTLAAWQEVARRIAHEIKNPLTPIGLCGERIARQVDRLDLPAEPARILRDCTATIANEVESVKTLVNEFSSFARFPTAQPAAADLNEIVEAALAVFAGRLDDIELQRDLAAGLPQVNVDREQFKRVVVNLVDNAAESMLESPLKRLFISTQAIGADTVELVVADSGCGVSPEDKERLFLPYFSTKGRGTGLGLAIVSHILTEHGASIRVEENPPQGTRFTVEIPAIVAEPETRPAEARA